MSVAKSYRRRVLTAMIRSRIGSTSDTSLSSLHMPLPYMASREQQSQPNGHAISPSLAELERSDAGRRRRDMQFRTAAKHKRRQWAIWRRQYQAGDEPVQLTKGGDPWDGIVLLNDAEKTAFHDEWVNGLERTKGGIYETYGDHAIGLDQPKQCSVLGCDNSCWWSEMNHSRYSKIDAGYVPPRTRSNHGEPSIQSTVSAPGTTSVTVNAGSGGARSITCHINRRYDSAPSGSEQNALLTVLSHEADTARTEQSLYASDISTHVPPR
ncbi:hypothetical protein HD553DRAFT_347823 [Filobasidium floriforme]|uniref:uncharacterized protein n=1 Tax=Filobasidium floriforme TaxID=5210 RepID=UPI001E8D243A|nr:uncharacterized protein HD553DRAFT_347823 [Filobasidium floriforme]KAH8089021.1 hypothetical protein HD553DRAFT_347823 [Filobasidium floriforme]